MLSPAAGTYTAAQTVTISDATAGATIYYTTNGTTPTTASSVYSAPIPVSATTTLNAIASLSGTNSAVASAVYTINPTSNTPLDVPLTTSTVDAITKNGTAVTGGGFDGDGNAYSSTLLGSTVSWSGMTFALGAPGVSDALTAAKISVSANNYSSVSLLGAAYDGNQPNQTFVVTYTDGTTSTFTQSISDWYTPQGYAGESNAVTMAYRVTASGALDNRTFYLYGYTFALNATKTVQSITLPNNVNVNILGIVFSPTTAAVAAPVVSPAAGTYTAAQTVTISDATAGATIYYTTNGTTPTTASSVYSAPIPVSATTTLSAIASLSGTNSAVASAVYTIMPPNTMQSVVFGSAGNINGIVANGSKVPNLGIDGQGSAFSSTLLGTATNWSSVPFTFAAAGTTNLAAYTSLNLPVGAFSKIYMLATGVNGNQTSQSFVVTYTDGTTTSASQSLSDWYTPQSFAGETIALLQAYRVSPDGSLDNREFNLYGYSFALNNAKTVRSISLPPNQNVVVLALTLVP